MKIDQGLGVGSNEDFEFKAKPATTKRNHNPVYVDYGCGTSYMCEILILMELMAFN